VVGFCRHHHQYSFYVINVIGAQLILIRCELTSFPIMSNESFTFDYNDKCGVELEFKPRGKGD
jgi:hypothetical protein